MEKKEEEPTGVEMELWQIRTALESINSNLYQMRVDAKDRGKYTTPAVVGFVIGMVIVWFFNQ